MVKFGLNGDLHWEYLHDFGGNQNPPPSTGLGPGAFADIVVDSSNNIYVTGNRSVMDNTDAILLKFRQVPEPTDMAGCAFIIAAIAGGRRKMREYALAA